MENVSTHRSDWGRDAFLGSAAIRSLNLEEFPSMDVELVSIGDEVLRGESVNSNAAFLSRELSNLGYTVRRHLTLPDEIEAIRSGLQEALKRSSFVISTGGLGPTIDDLTRN